MRAHEAVRGGGGPGWRIHPCMHACMHACIHSSSSCVVVVVDRILHRTHARAAPYISFHPHIVGFVVVVVAEDAVAREVEREGTRVTSRE